MLRDTKWSTTKKTNEIIRDVGKLSDVLPLIDSISETHCQGNINVLVLCQHKYLCQWAPAACQGFPLVTFGNFWPFTSFEFSKSGQPPLNTDWQWNLKPKKLPPQCRHQTLSWNSASQTQLFRVCQHIIVQVCPSIWHFENSSPLLWNPRYSEKGDLLDPFQSLCALFLLLCHFHMNLNIQNSWPYWSSTYRWKFSTGNHFHVKWSTNPRVTSILPTASISLCALPGRFQLRYYCSKLPPRFSVC